jgi:hypothetical protein
MTIQLFENLWAITHYFDERMKIGDERLFEVFIKERHLSTLYTF